MALRTHAAASGQRVPWSRVMGGRFFSVVAALAALVVAPTAAASDWLPHPADATWTYEWTDTVYSPTPTKEKITVKEQKAKTFVLGWTTADLENPAEAVTSVGTMEFQEGTLGLEVVDWSSNQPPPAFPVLCASRVACPNALHSTLYQLMWGNRGPLVFEPLHKGAAWNAAGGAQGDVTSVSTYVGREPITIPAFSQPVEAVKIRTEVTQAGALGDPYGSGVKTTWWVYGVGPVKIVFEHAGGTSASVTTTTLLSTNLAAKPTPPDTNYFPLEKGKKLTYRWTNAKHLKKPSVQSVTVEEVVNNSARLNVASVSGPIKVAGSYGYTVRMDGVTNIWGITKAASLATFPELGPRALPKAKRRRFFTPLDLMNFGFNPILSAYPKAGERWGSRTPSRDFSVFGVTGFSRVAGVSSVKVPGGTFRALRIESNLTQKGFPFGSGSRTTWFAPGKGLVKLVFRHRDGSTSTVELLK